MSRAPRSLPTVHDQRTAALSSPDSALALCARSSWDEIYRRACQSPELTFLSVDTTEACDLDCQGCYYHPDVDRTRRQVSAEALLGAVDQAYRFLSTRTLVFAGKEPLLNPGAMWDVLEHGRTGARSELSTGIITNGRHVRRHWKQLAHLAETERLSFVDVSFDSGVPAEHDAIRGRTGTFALAIDALEGMAAAFEGVRVGTSCVLRDGNAPGLLTLIARTAELPVSHWITPFLPPPFSGLPAIVPSSVVLFVSQLRRLLETDLAARSVDVTVSLPGIYVSDCVQAGLFDALDLREDNRGLLFVQQTVARSRLFFHCAILAEGAWRHARILSDGSYLPHLHYLQTANPHGHAAGRIQDTSIMDLYRRSIAPGTLFHQSLESRKSHMCRTRPCWPTCFGGWFLADDAVCRNQALSDQPWMCNKVWNDRAEGGAA